MRPRLALAAAVAIAAFLAVPAAPAGALLPEPSNSIVNQDFELGLPSEVVVERTVFAKPVTWIGSVMPRTLDHNARIAAPPWTATVLSGDRTPSSTTSWLAHGGERGSAALSILYDAEDDHTETLTIAQALGPFEVGSVVWSGGDAVRLDAYASKPVKLRAAVMTMADPTRWFVSDEVVVTTAELKRFTLPFRDEPLRGVLWVFGIYVYGGEESDGARLVLDNIAILGAKLLTVASVPTETDSGVGTCSTTPIYRVSTPTHVLIPPSDTQVMADWTFCVAGIMPYVTACAPLPCYPGWGGDNPR